MSACLSERSLRNGTIMNVTCHNCFRYDMRIEKAPRECVLAGYTSDVHRTLVIPEKTTAKRNVGIMRSQHTLAKSFASPPPELILTCQNTTGRNGSCLLLPLPPNTRSRFESSYRRPTVRVDQGSHAALIRNWEEISIKNISNTLQNVFGLAYCRKGVVIVNW